MVWSNNSQDSTGSPFDGPTGIVRAPHGNLQYFSYLTGSVRGPHGTGKGIDTTRIGKNPVRASYLARAGCSLADYNIKTRTGPVNLCLSHITLPGPVRTVPGLFTGCFEQKSYVHSRGPHGPRAAPYEFCLPVRGP